MELKMENNYIDEAGNIRFVHMLNDFKAFQQRKVKMTIGVYVIIHAATDDFDESEYADKMWVYDDLYHIEIVPEIGGLKPTHKYSLRVHGEYYTSNDLEELEMILFEYFYC